MRSEQQRTTSMIYKIYVHVDLMGEKRNVYSILVRKPEGKGPL
jgi:hypothetical protein